MDYTIHLKKSSYESIENTSLFSFLQENSNFSNFSHGVHATLAYYKEKTPHIHVVEENTSRKPCPTMTEEELCITTSESGLTITVNNLLVIVF